MGPPSGRLEGARKGFRATSSILLLGCGWLASGSLFLEGSEKGSCQRRGTQGLVINARRFLF